MNSTEQTATCTRCGRRLTSTQSITRGYGKGCAAKVRKAQATADLTGWSADQVAKAAELIEDGAVVRLRGRIYLAVSADGLSVHRTATTGQCTCKAGLKSSKPCYHVLAAQILTTAA